MFIAVTRSFFSLHNWQIPNKHKCQVNLSRPESNCFFQTTANETPLDQTMGFKLYSPPAPNLGVAPPVIMGGPQERPLIGPHSTLLTRKFYLIFMRGNPKSPTLFILNALLKHGFSVIASITLCIWLFSGKGLSDC